MYDIITFILGEHGHIPHITRKLKLLIHKHISFEWYSCKEHLEVVQSNFLDYSISLIIKKFYDDIYRNRNQKKTKGGRTALKQK